MVSTSQIFRTLVEDDEKKYVVLNISIYSMVIDIFIKSCKRDCWMLPFLLKTIEKYVTGFRQVIIIMDKPHDLKKLLNNKTRKMHRTQNKTYLNFIPGLSTHYHLNYNFEVKVITEKIPNYSIPEVQSQYPWMRSVTKGYVW